jgi:hypothetical protein
MSYEINSPDSPKTLSWTRVEQDGLSVIGLEAESEPQVPQTPEHSLHSGSEIQETYFHGGGLDEPEDEPAANGNGAGYKIRSNRKRLTRTIGEDCMVDAVHE